MTHVPSVPYRPTNSRNSAFRHHRTSLLPRRTWIPARARLFLSKRATGGGLACFPNRHSRMANRRMWTTKTRLIQTNLISVLSDKRVAFQKREKSRFEGVRCTSAISCVFGQLCIVGATRLSAGAAVMNPVDQR